MKTLLTIIVGVLIFNFSFGQDVDKLIGTWKFWNASTSNPDCKDVSYLPINTFSFKEDRLVEFKSDEGTASANYKGENSLIKLTDLSENGVKQEGNAAFEIKNLTETTLTLIVHYECGSIDLIFKR